MTTKRRHNFKHQTICLEPFVHHFPTAGAPHCDGDGDGVRTSEARHDCCRDLFCSGGDLVHTFCIFWSWFLLASCLNNAQTTFLNFTYFLSYNRANLIGAGDLIMLIIVILNRVVCRVFIIGLQSN